MLNLDSQRGKFSWVTLEEYVAVAAFTESAGHPRDRIGFRTLDVDLHEIRDPDAVFVEEIVDRASGGFEVGTFFVAGRSRDAPVAASFVEPHERADPGTNSGGYSERLNLGKPVRGHVLREH
jgi:hypothetical protein